MNRTFIMNYSHRGGFGQFINYRQDGTTPSEEDIVSMEKKVAEQHGLDSIFVTSIVVIADSELSYAQ